MHLEPSNLEHLGGKTRGIGPLTVDFLLLENIRDIDLLTESDSDGSPAGDGSLVMSKFSLCNKFKCFIDMHKHIMHMKQRGPCELSSQIQAIMAISWVTKLMSLLQGVLNCKGG